MASLAAARLTRLVIYDSFPPSAWIRTKWDNWTEGNSWNPLLHCHYCLAPWILLAAMLLGIACGIPVPGDGIERLWWFAVTWLGLAYIASIVVSYDGDD